MSYWILQSGNSLVHRSAKRVANLLFIATSFSVGYAHMLQQQTWWKFNVYLAKYSILLSIPFYFTLNNLSYLIIIYCNESNVGLMFTCLYKIFYQTLYMSDIIYPWYASKWILSIMHILISYVYVSNFSWVLSMLLHLFYQDCRINLIIL